MKNLIILFFLCLSNVAFAQNLYLIFDTNEPSVTKDIRKYLRLRGKTTPVMKSCGVGKINTHYYLYSYPFFAGESLELKKKTGTVPVSMSIAQSQSLYPNAKNAAQLDQTLQPAIEKDYKGDPPSGNDDDWETVKYFDQFQKIFVIEYLGNGQAQVVEVFVANAFE